MQEHKSNALPDPQRVRQRLGILLAIYAVHVALSWLTGARILPYHSDLTAGLTTGGCILGWYIEWLAVILWKRKDADEAALSFYPTILAGLYGVPIVAGLSARFIGGTGWLAAVLVLAGLILHLFWVTRKTGKAQVQS